MASAPGGKASCYLDLVEHLQTRLTILQTTHMAALMQNTGTIFANDANKARAKGLIGNIRMYPMSSIVWRVDGNG